MSKIPIRLIDYAPLEYRISHTHLTIELDPAATRISNTMRIEPTPDWKNGVVQLNGERLNLVSVKINEIEIEPVIESDMMYLPSSDIPFECEIVTEITPNQNTELEGIYWINGIFCSQNEPEGFRKITYFLDRPDNLSRFTTTIIGDQTLYPFMLSNGNLVKTEILDKNRHLAVWEDPFLKPSYLYALVAGRFDVVEDYFITMSGRRIQLQIYADPGYGPRCHYALQALKNAMSWDETQYGREYDLDRFMIVAIDAFNMGAMENKGLNVFNSAYILADPKTATDADYMGIESVVAHEYFHNWTGNRIT
ncbi:aminopeptidase N, partial [bacterium]|nr:aminopeptidase N [bacterium]